MSDRNQVLVTGGAGFIGSHVVDALVAQGHEVAVVDNLSTGRREHVNPQATLYEADITDAAAVERVFGEVSPRWVSHHAAQVSVVMSIKDPLEDARANIIGSLVVLEECRRRGVEFLVFASTGGGLYGDPEEVPCAESYPVRPLAPYGVGKYAVETYLEMYRATWGLNSAALRYANVYGPRQSHLGEAGVIAIFAGKMLTGQSPTIYGSGEQERDFIYVEDLVAAHLLVLERQVQGVLNVGTGVLTSVNRVAEALRRYCEYTGPILYEQQRPGEARRIALDAGLLQQATRWRPKASLEDGLQRTAAYFKQSVNDL